MSRNQKEEHNQVDWEAHSHKLLKKLENYQFENKQYQDALKRVLRTHQIASEEVDRQKREIALRDDDVNFLWNEIDMLRHGLDTVDEWKIYRETEVDHHRKKYENALRKAAYLEAVIEKQQRLLEIRDKEIELREQHFQELRQTRGWKIGKKFSKEDFNAPIDLSSLPNFPEEISEPDYQKISKLPPHPKTDPFETDFKRDPSIAKDFHASLESPRSFASPAIGQKVKFQGWCCDNNGKAAKNVWAKIGEDKIPCATGAIREDVVAARKESLTVDPRCGFQAEVSTGPGENFIEIHAEFEDGSHALMFKRIILNLGFETTPKRQLDEDYQSWIKCFDTYSTNDLKKLADEQQQFEKKPLISILLPVYNTEEKWLSQVIESVVNQVYPKWELCIADDHSPSPHVKDMLDHYAQKDDRIKIVYRKENGHISAATNSALDVATGDFCALLDHDDVLPKHALFYVAKELNKFPESDIIFSDEDKIDENGKRFDPYFKSDWNPDLFLSHNCISHLGIYRTSILRKIKGFQEDLYGSQDWDMALRFLLHTTPSKIRHIPRVLYHWRYLDSSTAKTIDSKPYAVTAGQKAIENYLKSIKQDAEVTEGMWPGAYRVKYKIAESPKASIIIPTRDQKQVTEQCIESILKQTTYSNYEIILVDNQSSDQEAIDYFDSLKNHNNVRVLQYNQPFNFSAINNFAAKESDAEVLVFLNNDIEVQEPGWLEELVSQATRPEVGVAGGWLLFPDHTVQHAGILMGVCGIAVESFKHQLEWNIGHMGRAHLNQYYSAVTGACMATKRDVFIQLGGFNEQDLAIAYNDVDYCLRVSRDAGLATVWTPYAKLIHHESVSRGYEISPEQQKRFQKESNYMIQNWSHIIKNDPYYNPNLSKFATQHELAWPPRVSDEF